jgi:1-acyl-sn-glycerol-3-phosphate acyltransferase
MSISQAAALGFFRTLTSAICQIEDAALERVPSEGPLILVTNHVNVLEIPLFITRLHPRPISGFFAAYRMDSFWMRWFLTTFGGIPVRRGAPDREALDQAVERINAGDIFGLTPEGTRSGDGCLQKGKPGVVHLALETNAPILPMVHWGSENWQQNLARLRRTPFHIAVGNPFRLNPTTAIKRSLRDEILLEIMVEMACLLPRKYRGVYASSPARSPIHLHFLDEHS